MAEFVSESLAERKQEEQRKERQMSDMLHALPTESSGAAEIFELNAKLREKDVLSGMSAFLSGLRNGM